LQLLARLHDNDFRDAQGREQPPFDVIIVARGGGSLEDLWAFNDEAVVRTLADMPVPVVSGVGHEIDFTIADFVVDLRAPTPSAAAELVSPDQQQWREQLALGSQRLQRAMSRELGRQRQQLLTLSRRLRSPARQLQDQRQRLDELELRLQTGWQRSQRDREQRLAQLGARIRAQHPARRLQQLRHQLLQLRQRAERSLRLDLEQRQRGLASLAQRAQSVSPLNVIARGYAIVSDNQGQVVRQLSDAPPGSEIRARLANGVLHATVTRQQELPATTPSSESEPT
ncbi:MAG: exodeoxyribonuclease VII large subunit, partial [Perlucidibaca sp.]